MAPPNTTKYSAVVITGVATLCQNVRRVRAIPNGRSPRRRGLKAMAPLTLRAHEADENVLQ